MRIVIADGYQEADYIINLFLNKKNKISVINSNMEIAKALSVKNNVFIIMFYFKRFTIIRSIQNITIGIL